MKVLAFDVGSSSVKAGIVQRGKVVGKTAHAAFGTHYENDRAEVSAGAVLRAVRDAFAQLGAGVRKVDVIAMTVMAPSWLAMDRHGNAITPVVTHQDRRSVDDAKALIREIGKARLLRISGNLPFPGGISSTTWRWFLRNQKSVMRKADLVGHLQTYLHRQMNGARVVDPSNASFMGVYETLSQRGWSESLCAAVGVQQHQLPQLIEAEGVAGMVSRAAGEKFGLTHGTPMLVGCMDTSAVMMLTGGERGRLLNITGSTDVLALCTDKPVPSERLLTRALGIGRDRWLSVSALAAAGSALNWARDQLYHDYPAEKFFKLVEQIAADQSPHTGGVTFEPYLAGERTSIDQRRGTFSGLSLSTTRRQMLAALIESLAKASAARLDALSVNRIKINREVITSGGAVGKLDKLLHRDWPGEWTFRFEPDANLRGLASIAEG